MRIGLIASAFLACSFFSPSHASSWVQLAASANGDYRSFLDTDSFEQMGADNWIVWVRLQYASSRRDRLFSPSYRTDLRRYAVRCKERSIATIQRILQDEEGAPVLQERYPESKWTFNHVGPQGNTSATEIDAICSLSILPLRRLDFSRSGNWKELAPGMVVDATTAVRLPPYFFYRTLITNAEVRRINDKRLVASVAYFIGNCQDQTSGIYAIGQLGEANDLIGSSTTPLSRINMSRFTADSPSGTVFRAMCAQAESGEGDKSASHRPSAGTAFFVTGGGHLLTNAHVVTDCKSITIRGGGTTGTAALMALDKGNDLALLKSDLKPEGVLSFRTPAPQVGEHVYAFGFPLL